MENVSVSSFKLGEVDGKKEARDPDFEQLFYLGDGYYDELEEQNKYIIIGRKGTINNPIFVEEHFWNVDTAFGLKANDAILDKYLYYFCLSFDFSKLDKSTAMPSLTKTSIGNVLIPIPPYKEQERIVAKIDMVLDTMNEILRAV